MAAPELPKLCLHCGGCAWNVDENEQWWCDDCGQSDYVGEPDDDEDDAASDDLEARLAKALRKGDNK